jgi:formylglycine-generating enzyme required for sulfatase activity
MAPLRRILIPLLLAACLRGQGRPKRVERLPDAQRQSFERQPKVAVLAGVGHYPSRSGLSTLQYPARDVDQLEAELRSQGYKVVALKEQEATKGSVVQALRDAAELVDKDSGTVLFFFSGHGFADKGANYLATFEATSGDLAGSGLAVKAVEDLLKSTGAVRQVIFLDACRNEAGKSTSTRTFDRFQTSSGLRELFSTKMGRVSYEDDQLQNGVFAHYLIRGLHGEAAGADGLITFRDLADYVTESVSAYGFQHGRMQVPYEGGESSGDFLLARAKEVAVVGPQAGDVKTNPKDGQRYVWIPPGRFQMGCSPGDAQCYEDEKPAHPVEITKGFWMGQTAVTVGAYKRSGKPMPPEPKLLDRPLNANWADLQQPIVNVTWDEAVGFCEAAGMRLPTEAEWEYAARAGTTGARYGTLDDIAWYANNSGEKRLDADAIWKDDQKNYATRLKDNGNGPHAVGTKLPNVWKLYDMLGNVWQWTADWYDAKYYEQKEGRDPLGPPSGTQRTLRGGSWDSNTWYSRVSLRVRYEPSVRNYGLGFRCIGE